ncbi:lysophospholipase II [Xylaria sp. FL1042]|nr:lysophospholipase II [Xylaria sp. FL1042]
MASNTTYIVEPTAAHTHTVIFLHGRDSNGREFADELFESEASETVGQLADQSRTLPDLLPNIRWVFPNAPVLQSERFGIEMSQWFDMWSLDDPTERPELQQPGLDQSVNEIFEVIKEEETLVPQEQIFLAGISQGFVTAVVVFLTKANPSKSFAGLIGLCSWLPAAFLTGDYKKFDRREKIGSTPIFLGHSEDDDVVPIDCGLELEDFLRSQGLRVEWIDYYEGGHWVNEPQGVDDIARFIRKRTTEN